MSLGVMVQSVSGCIWSYVHLLITAVNYYLDQFNSFLDYYVPGWRMVLFSPFIIVFVILPFLLVIYLYLSSLLLYVYRKRQPILTAFSNHNVAEGYRQTIAAFWAGHGAVWHGYEVVGLDNIPDKGAALLIYYHGALPIDIYYLIANIYIEKERTIRNVMDKFAFKIPGLAALFRFWGSFPGPRSEVVRFLKEGELVSIAPGGVREAIFSTNYSLVWQERLGFARAAIEANVPILPVFTENCRQAFNNIGSKWRIFRWIYEYTRLPVLLVYGGFPVKLRTYIGQPIRVNPGQTAIELATETKRALQMLIYQYQDPKRGILKGICQRFTSSNSPTSSPCASPGRGEDEPLLLGDETHIHQRITNHSVKNL